MLFIFEFNSTITHAFVLFQSQAANLKAKVKPFAPIDVSAKLQPYARRDLLASHSKRIERAGVVGWMPRDESVVLSKVLHLTVEERAAAAAVRNYVKFAKFVRIVAILCVAPAFAPVIVLTAPTATLVVSHPVVRVHFSPLRAHLRHSDILRILESFLTHVTSSPR